MQADRSTYKEATLFPNITYVCINYKLLLFFSVQIYKMIYSLQSQALTLDAAFE